jgi:N-acetylglucosaminyldiphosphoundecaprenol N-acetyl-beta-D-mannosaminyltransferase
VRRSEAMKATRRQELPPRFEVFGTRVSATRYEELVPLLMARAAAHEPTTVDHMPVHVLVEAARNAAFRRRLNELDIVAPDGQPVRWAMNWLHATGLKERVYGPELMLRLCREACRRGISIYLYGSTPEVLERLVQSLRDRFPGLAIAGWESPPFRPLSASEDAAAVDRINRSGAGLVFLGLGGPRQEVFAHAHRASISAVQLCVGAAFDFLAGTKRMAPAWMQRRGLEWLFRLITEPRRLWRRYLVTNTVFSMLLARRLILGPALGGVR